jgi:hypothetical protein
MGEDYMRVAIALIVCAVMSFLLQPARSEVGPDCNGISFGGLDQISLPITGCPDRLDRSEYNLPYVGHDEPAVLFFSDKPHSASNFQ